RHAAGAFANLREFANRSDIPIFMRERRRSEGPVDHRAIVSEPIPAPYYGRQRATGWDRKDPRPPDSGVRADVALEFFLVAFGDHGLVLGRCLLLQFGIPVAFFFVH